MIFFKKSKPTLRDLIPVNSVDIHSHLLPGIDDGSQSIADTNVLLSEMTKIGFTSIITTPHIFATVWNNSEKSIENKFIETDLIVQKPIELENFGFACEYMLDSNFMKRLEVEKLLTLKNNLILIEMSYLSAPIQLYEIIFEIQLKGYIPVLAHPERYIFYHNNFKEYEKLKNAGCLFQLNLLSVVDYYGKMIGKTADKLLKYDLIDFVGSDIHHKNHIASFDRKINIKNSLKLELAIEKNLFFIK
ncbi:tyrosine-protein phosphatase [Flavobacterium sp.]